MNALTNGATIEVVATGERYHTITDWGLAIGNNDYIGDVEQEKYYVDVPGTDGFLDFSEATTGRRIFKNRPINIELGGKKPRNDWDIIISDIRNLIEGREIKVILGPLRYPFQKRTHISTMWRILQRTGCGIPLILKQESLMRVQKLH